MRKLVAYLLCLSTPFISMAQSNQISGTIKNNTGNALPGVNIVEKYTNNHTLSDSRGSFTISTKKEGTLVISYVGYTSQEIKTSSSQSISITLIPENKSLSEVVVTSFGISREKRALGYNVGTVKSDEITKAGATNFATALYGKVPGLNITATPGGATSAININIRGIYSITGRNQPLIVVDGIPIRNEEVNNSAYFSDTRVRGNGLLDINPEDIESISVLKGAAAAALYGSDAVNNGAILITTKTGKKAGKNITIDLNMRYGFDKIAYLPRYQNVRGPGFPSNYPGGSGGQNDSGFVYYDTNGDGIKESRGLVNTNLNFGPAFDGQPTLGWDGKMHPYVPGDVYTGLFEPTPKNSSINVAAAIDGERSNIRFSLTRQDNEMLSLGSYNYKNMANINGTFKLTKSLTTTIMINYINQDTKNRPYMVDRLINNFTGMMDRFEDPSWYLDRYRTSKGYRFVTGAATQSLTPAENIIYPNFKSDIADYVWRVKQYQTDEYSNRLISSITNNWDIIKGLSLRTRISTDNTNTRTEDKRSSEQPVEFNYTGLYSVNNNLYQIMYGDALLSYRKKINTKTEIGILAGYTATKETGSNATVSTAGGLSTENFFDIAASVNAATGTATRRQIISDALIGTVNVGYKNYLFAEATIRRDRTSRLNPNANAVNYFSFNTGFVFSDAFKLPSFVSYAKLRASYGTIGSYPDVFQANIAYTQGTFGVQAVGGKAVLYTLLNTNFGNDGIRPEKRNEFEVGLEAKFLKNRISLDLNYYNGTVANQLLPLTISASSGAKTVFSNAGDLENKGIELALSGTIIKTKKIQWDMIINYAHNKNKLKSLPNGATQLLHVDWDGSGAQLVSNVGSPMGDILVHPIATNANGQPIVDPNGMYKIDAINMVKVGNVMPKATGGIVEIVGYKNFTLEATFDYKIGGSVLPAGFFFLTSRGLTKESLNAMDAAHGGLSYYQNSAGKKIQTSDPQGPNGEKVFHDGMLLSGVKADGTPNDNIVSSAVYYNTAYNWGGPQYSPNGRYDLAVKENSYVKLRELSIGYTLPPKIANRIKASNITISLYARNLFYLYRTIKDMDAEQTTSGSRWYQNVYNVGTNPSTRSYGIMLRSSF